MKKLSLPLDFFYDERLQAAVQRHGILAENAAIRILMAIRRDGDAARWTETLCLRICREVPGLEPDTANALVADLAAWGFLPASFLPEISNPSDSTDSTDSDDSFLPTQNPKQIVSINDIPVPFPIPECWMSTFNEHDLRSLVDDYAPHFRYLRPTYADANQYIKFRRAPNTLLSPTSLIPIVGFYRWLYAHRHLPDLLSKQTNNEKLIVKNYPTFANSY